MKSLWQKSGTIHVFFLIAFLMWFITGCSAANSYQRSIYFDDSKISKQGDSYSYKSRVGNFCENSVAITFDGFYGKQTMCELDVEKDAEIELDLDTEIENGKFKICLINNEKDVSIISEDTVKKLETLSLLKGKYYIAIVGDNAKGKIDLEVWGNDMVSIKQIKD